MNTRATYAQAGVNIEAGNRLVEKIKPLAKMTTRKGVMGGIGGFGALFDLKAAGFKDPVLVSTTDGVGTKIKLAIDMGKHDTIGIDLVAMCVNDLVVQGAQPLFFLDYFATSSLQVEHAAQVIAGIAEGCRMAECALVGGETAEMPGMYAPGDYDLAGFAVGAAERDQLLPKQVNVGDVILGLASSGVHSNGYSLVRHLIKDFSVTAPFAPGRTLADVLLVPTRIYVTSVMQALAQGGIKALAHITGGGITENLPRVLPEGVSARIDCASWERPAIFQWLQQRGSIADDEMLRTFNCGIGMVLVVDPGRVETIRKVLGNYGETVCVLGDIVPRGSQSVIYKT